ncbi:MAG: hypothetical protein FWH07_05865 [Oscillospiraceae bacterium]|nr:hypothetical protein [Oscillospiraceae bacterium]
MSKQSAGRPIVSNNVTVVPEFRASPDVEKLARVFIEIAMKRSRKSN